MHRRAKRDKDNCGGLTIYIAGERDKPLDRNIDG
jgi:hypothetical protein